METLSRAMEVLSLERRIKLSEEIRLLAEQAMTEEQQQKQESQFEIEATLEATLVKQDDEEPNHLQTDQMILNSSKDDNKRLRLIEPSNRDSDGFQGTLSDSSTSVLCFMDLPHEVLIRIISMLPDLSDFLRLRCVCRAFAYGSTTTKISSSRAYQILLLAQVW